jgi:hypothetical protein
MSLMLEERPAPAPVAAPGAPEVVVRVDHGRAPRRLRTSVLGWLAALVLAGVLALGAIVAVRGWSFFGDLFAPRTIDRSAPVLVQRLRNQTRYTAATGTFNAVVDIEHQTGFIPTFVAGSRSIYSGVGDVDATVDFRALSRHVERAADGTVVLRLPHARIGAVHLDSRHSHVMSRERGVIDRVEGVFVDSPTSDREVQRIAERRIGRAAVKSDLRSRAERNTATMIQHLATALGAGKVDVRFGPA